MATAASKVLVSATLFLLWTTCSGGSFPTRPIRIIVPYTVGGTNDVVTRLYADQLQRRLGQPVITEPRPGGESIPGTDLVVKALPDGHTLLSTGSGVMTLGLLFRDLPFDPERDLLPVARLSRTIYFFVVHSSVPATTLQGFIAYARANPGKLNYAMSGGATRLDWVVFKGLTGVNMVEVPYKGATPAIVSIVANESQVTLVGPGSIQGHIDAGRVRLLATSGEHRSLANPGVPTMSEAGLPGFQPASTAVVFAPPRTPADVVELLNAQLGAITDMPQIQERLKALGFEVPERISTQDLQRDLLAYAGRYREAAKAGGISPE